MAGKKRSMSLDADVCDVQKEWEEVLCPICMEHPHNAVLLLCTSHAKGCRSHICDTSYRHSNCLDRFRKLKEASGANLSDTSSVPSNIQGSSPASGYELIPSLENDLSVVHRSHNRGDGITSARRVSNRPNYDNEQEATGRQNSESIRNDLESEELVKKSSLKCPLCRGDVLGWTVVEEARTFLNLKPRSCTRELCTFVGDYLELRRHARRDHPRVRPAEVDPSRQRAWTRFEHQREHDDIVSAIRSAMPGAMVFGDYVIDSNERALERESTPSDSDGRLFTTLVLFQMLGSMQSMVGPRTHSRPWTRHRRYTGGSSRQRAIWGENLLGFPDEEGDGNESFTEDDEMNTVANEAEQGSLSGPRQRRRLTQSGLRRNRL